MTCPRCGDRLIRERAGGAIDVFFRRLLTKGEGAVAVCRCGAQVPAPPEVAAALRKAVLLRRAPRPQGD